MENFIRVKKVQINNIKNVCHGQFKTNTNFEKMEKADIIGIFGQNGSGKTAVVEAFNILQLLLLGKALPKMDKHLMTVGKNITSMIFEFLVSNEYGKFTLVYECSIKQGNEYLYVSSEKLSYKENSPRRRFKTIIFKANEDLTIKTRKISTLSEVDRVNIRVIDVNSRFKHCSFIFNRDLSDVYKKSLDNFEIKLVDNLIHDFTKNLYIINTNQKGLVLANVKNPFNNLKENYSRHFSCNLDESTIVLVESCFSEMETEVKKINMVLKTIISDLQITIKNINKETLSDGTSGIRFELMSTKCDVELPLKRESAGILKLISILSFLIEVNNNPNACAIIDGLDSDIFEHLLGEIIMALDENGKGQLLFTSHNLRVLEVLDAKKMWFTTTNKENKFIQLIGVKNLSNARDIYIRALLLGGQKEELCEESDYFYIKKSLFLAGEIDS